MRQVLMIGTGVDTRGGIAAVVKVYEAQGLLEPGVVDYIATHGDGSRWRKLGLAAGAWLRYLPRLLAGQVALLHVHSASGPSFWRKCLFMLPAFACNVPVVLHWHGGGFVPFFRACSPRRQRFIAWVFRRCDRIVALSSQWNDTLRACIPGIAPVTLTNPVQLPAEAASLRGDPPTVLFLGLVSEAKGVTDLLQAWPRVLQRVPQARLRIGGTGHVPAAQALARSLSVEGSVDWLGWIDAEAKSRELSQAWVLTLPSHNEGVPMAILEAMAAGVPVVASEVGGIPLAVRDGLDGLLVPPREPAVLADTLCALLLDAERRQAMGASARRRAAEEFAAEAIVSQVRALWGEVLGAGAGDRRRVPQ